MSTKTILEKTTLQVKNDKAVFSMTVGELQQRFKKIIRNAIQDGSIKHDMHESVIFELVCASTALVLGYTARGVPLEDMCETYGIAAFTGLALNGIRDDLRGIMKEEFRKINPERTDSCN